MRARLYMVMLLLACGSAQAVTIERPLADPAQEQAAQGAIHQLKCVVCEGQSLADSDADFAREMRAEIRRMAAQGDSTREILTYFRSRYGARILLTPPVEAQTIPLWFGPLLLLLLGSGLLWRMTRRRSGT